MFRKVLRLPQKAVTLIHELRDLPRNRRQTAQALLETRQQVEGLQSETRQQVESLNQSVAQLNQQVAQLNQQVAHLNQQAAHLMYHVSAIRKRMDLMNSCRDVPREWVEEYLRWKDNRSLPSEPLVSVCVSTYNRGKLLTERCLPSILKQSYQRLEVIVVGDHCTDATEQRVATIHDPRLKFVNLPERGRYPADPVRRWMVAGSIPGNRTLEMSQGDFITHLDDDDEYVPDRIERLVQFAIENRFDFVWHPFWWQTSTGDFVIEEAREFEEGHVTTASVFYHSWFKRIRWDIDAHLLEEPGDWNMFRKIKYLNPAMGRYPAPLLYHYAERSQMAAAA